MNKPYLSPEISVLFSERQDILTLSNGDADDVSMREISISEIFR